MKARRPMSMTTVASVYFAQRGPYMKIGVSQDPEARIKRLRYAGTSNVIPDDAKLAGEFAMHLRFAPWCAVGEWFRVDDELLAEVAAVAREYADGFTPHDWLTAHCARLAGDAA